MHTICLGVAGMAFSGCLLPGPPELEPAPRVPPVIDMLSSVPDPREILIADRNEPLTFTVIVHSNEADGELAFLIYPPNQPEPYVRTRAPKPFGGPGVVFAYPYTAPSQDGCYLFSIKVTHRDNVDGDNQIATEHEGDVAMISWWISVESDEIPNTLADCPEVVSP